jgi:hypothetical protein
VLGPVAQRRSARRRRCTAAPTDARETTEERGGSPARGRRRGMTATGERRGGMATDRASAASDRGGWDGSMRGKASGGQREAVGRATSGARRAGGRRAVPTAALRCASGTAHGSLAATARCQVDPARRGVRRLISGAHSSAFNELKMASDENSSK